jgi:hypothetical protein
MDGCDLTCGNKRAPVSGRREGEVRQLIVAGYRVAKEAMAVAEDVASELGPEATAQASALECAILSATMAATGAKRVFAPPSCGCR